MPVWDMLKLDLDWVRVPGIRRRESTILNLFATLYFYMGLALIMPVIIALWYHEDAIPFLATMILVFGISIPLLIFYRSSDYTRPTEAMFVVSVVWLFVMVIGAMPYILSGMNVLDALFESMSGFTTTGATIITDFSIYSRSIYFWRSLTQWIGGAGIIMIFVSIFPILGVGGRNLFKNEFPGLDVQNITERIRAVGKKFHWIYMGVSGLMILFLMISGVGWYESLVVMFSTMSTGGFSPHPESIAFYNSVIVEWIVIVFMFLAGSNFYLHYYALTKRDPWVYTRSTEWVTYFTVGVAGIIGLLWALDLENRIVFWAALVFLIIAIFNFYIHNRYYQGKDGSTCPRKIRDLNISAILMLTLMLAITMLAFDSPDQVESALRATTFQSISIMTSTGFATVDYVVLWGSAAQIILLVLMFIGGSTGSTGGGFKSARVLLSGKIFYRSLKKLVHPRAIFTIKLDGRNLSEEALSSVLAMFLAYMGMVLVGSLILMILGVPYIEAVSSMFATMSNTGPGLGAIGPYGSYAWFPPAGKVLLIFTMWAGRLELLTVFAFLTPVFWREMLKHRERRN